MSTEPATSNQPFNITNGDIFRWENMWPHIADYFGMETAPAQKIDLPLMMADKDGLWTELTRQHELQEISYPQLVNWNYGAFVFTPEYDIISSMSKARRFGFHDIVESREMFLRQFDQLREERVIPAI
jgi:hypothetical protein